MWNVSEEQFNFKSRSLTLHVCQQCQLLHVYAFPTKRHASMQSTLFY